MTDTPADPGKPWDPKPSPEPSPPEPRPAAETGNGGDPYPRNRKGRFGKGNPGRPPRALAEPSQRGIELMLIDALKRAITTDEIAGIVKNLIRLAVTNNPQAVSAAQLVLHYAVGKPRQAYSPPIKIDLPPISCADDLPAAYTVALDSVREGKISAEELEVVLKILDGARQAFGEPAMRRELDELRALLDEREQARA